MLNKRILSLSSTAGKDAAKIIVLNWLGLLCNIAAMACLAFMVQGVYQGVYRRAGVSLLALPSLGIIAALGIRCLCTMASQEASFLAGSRVKRDLRERIYRKLINLGPSYNRRVSTAETVQLSGEGVDQLESYFGRYVPQLFYSLLAPLTLFAVLSRISLRVALALLGCVPLIPITIALVQTFAKKLLGKYWTSYTKLGDSFLENLQGLTTLKIYHADERRHREMNEEAERFRRVTMRVLLMQLNSITIMDVIAYGGAALGIVLAMGEFRRGVIGVGEAFFIIMIGAEFFIPMRLLGSYFHVAMNGVAASAKIFRLLDLDSPAGRPPEPGAPAGSTPAGSAPEPGVPGGGVREPGPLSPAGTTGPAGEVLIRLRDLSFAYEPDRPILRNVDLEIPRGGFIALVGESGSGKSTIAAILSGRAASYTGHALLGGTEIAAMDSGSLLKTLTLVNHNSYLFAGTLRENLLMAKPGASDGELRDALTQVRLEEFITARGGLETVIAEEAANLSGGQKQRIALARALLHDTAVYVFDEASSNIDMESEEAIMEAINNLAARKTVLLITHRLANARRADAIAVLDQGRLAASGPHEDLIRQGGIYERMYRQQEELEALVRGGDRV
jgi:ABC-type transport system involved in cytochrome bd biosynthesis fused ATPase/permease subunit